MTRPRRGRATRPFALTGGRAGGPDRDTGERPSMQTIFRAAPDVPPTTTGLLSEEWQRVLGWCAGPGVAVAEIAARLGWRITPTTTLLAKMREAGLLEQQAADPAPATDISFLLRLRSALEQRV
ncbi:DUF742 domain-containing protein [Streptomyces sp. NPDC049881]|uniref:DUF742 domain-containing protein n=1 Tax=unclassified Streptomyces TaxID=2593676 RepID=UPI003412E4E1